MLTLIAATVLRQEAFPPTLLVLNKGNDTVWLVDLDTGKRRTELPTGPNPNEVAVSPDQRTAAISNMGTGGRPPGTTITLVDVASAKVKATLDINPNGAPHGIYWLDDKTLAFTSHVTDTVNTFDVASGKLVRSVKSEQKGTHLVVFPPDQKRAFAVNAFSGTVTAFDWLSGKVLKQISTGDRAEGISISPDGKTVACGNVGADKLSLISGTSFEVTKTLAGLKMPIRTLFTADGKSLVVSNVGTGSLEAFRVADGKPIASVALRQKPLADPKYGDQWPVPMNLFRRKNGHIMVVLVTSHAVAEVDPEFWKVVKTFDTGPLPDGMAVSEPM